MKSGEDYDSEYVLSDEDEGGGRVVSSASSSFNFDLLEMNSTFPSPLTVHRRVYGQESNGAILHAKSLEALLKCGHTPMTAADQSWSSSLATPLTNMACPNELNTEERKVLLPSDDAQLHMMTSPDDLHLSQPSSPNERAGSRLNPSTSRLSKRLFSPRSSVSSNTSPNLPHTPSLQTSSLASTVPFTSPCFSPTFLSRNIKSDSQSSRNNEEGGIKLNLKSFEPLKVQSSPIRRTCEEFRVIDKCTNKSIPPDTLKHAQVPATRSCKSNRTPNHLKLNSIDDIKDLLSPIMSKFEPFKFNNVKSPVNEFLGTEEGLGIESSETTRISKPMSPILGKKRRHRKSKLKIKRSLISDVSTTVEKKLPPACNNKISVDCSKSTAQFAISQEMSENSKQENSNLQIPKDSTCFKLTENIPGVKTPEDSTFLQIPEKSSAQVSETNTLEKLPNKPENVTNSPPPLTTTPGPSTSNTTDLQLADKTTSMMSPLESKINIHRPISPILNISRATKKRKIKTHPLRLKSKHVTTKKQDHQLVDVLARHDLALSSIQDDVQEIMRQLDADPEEVRSPSKPTENMKQIASKYDGKQSKPSDKVQENERHIEPSYEGNASTSRCDKQEINKVVLEAVASKIKSPHIIPSDHSFNDYSLTEIDRAIEEAAKAKRSITPSPPKSHRKKICFSRSSKLETSINLNVNLSKSNELENTVRKIKIQVANAEKTKMLYPITRRAQEQSELTQSDLERSAVLLEKAKLIPKSSPSTLPTNQKEPIKFSDLVLAESEDEIDEDVELLINLLDADEALFGHEQTSTVTSTPCAKIKLESPELDISPIKNSTYNQSDETPVVDQKLKSILQIKTSVKDNCPSSSTPLTSRLKKKTVLVSTPLVNKAQMPDFDATPISKPSNFHGFATASGKKLQLSEKALQKAKLLFDEENLPKIDEIEEDADDFPPLEPKQLFHDEIEQPTTSKFIGFATAAGKIIKPSESALEKAKHLFGDNLQFQTSTEIDPVSLLVENYIDDNSLIKLADACTPVIHLYQFNQQKVETMATTECEIQIKQETTENENQSANQINKKMEAEAETDNKYENDNNKKSYEEISSLDEYIIEQMEQLEETVIKNLTIKNESKVKVEINLESSLHIQGTKKEQNNKEHRKPEVSAGDTSEKFHENELSTSDNEVLRDAELLEATSMINEKSEREVEAVENFIPDKKLGNNEYKVDSKNIPALDSMKEKNSAKEAQESFEDSEIDSLLADFCENNEIIQERNPPDNKNLPLQGFSTASGKKLKVSDKALHAARKQFEEVSKEVNIEVASTAAPRKRLSGEISDISLPCTKKVKVGDTVPRNLTCELLTFEDVIETNCHQALSGFSTASGKSIQISQEAITKAQKLFDDTEVEKSKTNISASVTLTHGKLQATSTEVCENMDTKDTGLKTGQLQGFATASGKKVDVSEKALAAAKKRFEETEVNDSSFNSEAFQGFATASGKTVEVSAKAIAAAKKKFEETDVQEPSVETGSFKGFATASGKTVEVSAKAIAAAKKLFEDGEMTASPQMGGFSTAGGKKVIMSEKAIEAASKKFQEVEANELNNTPSPQTSGIQGFATASGKKVSVSDEAIAAAKKKFEEFETNEFSSHETKGFQGFATASGKQVAISEAAILAAKQRFEETDAREFSSPKTSGVQGFATASGKQVAVSDEAIAAARQRFEEDAPKMINIVSSSGKRKFSEMNDINNESPSMKIPSLCAAGNKYCDETINEEPRVAEDEEVSQITQSSETQSTQSQASKSPILVRRTRITHKKKKLFSEARQKQSLSIQAKSREKVYQSPGVILRTKRSQKNVIKLKDISDEDSQSNAVRAEVLTINSVTAQQYSFKLAEMTTCTDGATVIPNNYGEVGVEEIESAFLASPGVDTALIPPGGWIRNHYRWIVWKLAATERRFPNQFNNYLSLDNVMSQLKFRYDREIDLAHRPAVRRITEQDSPPSTRMILCVSEIHENEYIVLTDNWYSIKTKVDEEMIRLINNKKVVEGTKLVIHGAEFLAKYEACHPLQQSTDLMLKISTNSTRRAHWAAMLGFCCKCPEPLNINLNSVLPYGGLIGEMWCSVARVYPPMFAEHSQEKEGSNKTIIRSERAEKAFAEKHERERQKLLERVVAEEKCKICKEQEKEAVRRRHSFNAGDLGDGESLCFALEADPDLHTTLTDTQRDLASEWSRDERERWSRQLEDRIRARVQTECCPRSVSTLLKLRLVPVKESEPSAVLSMWRPNDDVVKLVQAENAVIKIFNCFAAGRRNGELCINTTKQTKILDACPDSLNTLVIRQVKHISCLSDNSFKPMFNEVDIVGIVTNIEPIQRNNLQVVTLCDSTGYQVAICFWGGLESQGLSQVIIPGVSIAASNLQWRKCIKKNLNSSSKSLPSLHASESSCFSREPTETYLKEALQNLRATLDPEITSRTLKNCLSACVQKPKVETAGKTPCKDVHKRMSALARYGDPPPISPLPIPRSSRVLLQNFQLPTKLVDDNQSPPLSLSE